MYTVLMMFALAWLTPGMVAAYEVEQTIVTEPYEVVPVEFDLDDTSIHLGTLEQYPIMYEFTVDRTVDLQLQLLQRYQSQSFEPVPLSLIAVRKTDTGGVAEVGRLVDGGEAGWQAAEYPSLGVTALASESFVATIAPGTYRVEVSTPANEGRYALLIGSETPPDGYFETIRNTRLVQQHFGYSVVRLLGSGYVFYPLGILILLVLIQRTWRYRTNISHAS